MINKNKKLLTYILVMFSLILLLSNTVLGNEETKINQLGDEQTQIISVGDIETNLDFFNFISPSSLTTVESNVSTDLGHIGGGTTIIYYENESAIKDITITSLLSKKFENFYQRIFQLLDLMGTKLYPSRPLIGIFIISSIFILMVYLILINVDLFAENYYERLKAKNKLPSTLNIVTGLILAITFIILFTGYKSYLDLEPNLTNQSTTTLYVDSFSLLKEMGTRLTPSRPLLGITLVLIFLLIVIYFILINFKRILNEVNAQLFRKRRDIKVNDTVQYVLYILIMLFIVFSYNSYSEIKNTPIDVSYAPIYKNNESDTIIPVAIDMINAFSRLSYDAGVTISPSDPTLGVILLYTAIFILLYFFISLFGLIYYNKGGKK